MITARVGIAKLRKMRLNFILQSHDAAAAFHGGTHADLREVLMTRMGDDADQADLVRLASKRAVMTMKIDAQDATIHMHPNSGGTMGDCNEGEFFMSNYYRAVNDYGTQTFFDVVAPLVEYLTFRS